MAGVIRKNSRKNRSCQKADGAGICRFHPLLLHISHVILVDLLLNLFLNNSVLLLYDPVLFFRHPLMVLEILPGLLVRHFLRAFLRIHLFQADGKHRRDHAYQ
jgi:hypothetical protein